MLVCVKTLVDVPSFEDVRNSKEWLTTSETWQYIAENSVIAFADLCQYRSSYLWCWGDTSIEENEEKENEYKEIIKQLNCYRVAYQEMYAKLAHVTVKDNAGTNVKFYNIATIREYIQCSETRKAKVKAEIEHRKERLSFYDPEWFQ